MDKLSTGICTCIAINYNSAARAEPVIYLPPSLFGSSYCPSTPLTIPFAFIIIRLPYCLVSSLFAIIIVDCRTRLPMIKLSLLYPIIYVVPLVF